MADSNISMGQAFSAVVKQMAEEKAGAYLPSKGAVAIGFVALVITSGFLLWYGARIAQWSHSLVARSA